MGWKFFFSFVFILFVIGLLVFYWFLPFGTNEFTAKLTNSNFTSTNSSLQFYSNMRFPDSKISYKIDELCTIEKKDEMKRAFQMVADGTLLNFYPAASDEEITVTCDEKTKVEGTLFIAGEGGPTNITVTGKYNLIMHGKILLIRPTQCPNPNVAIHELLHVLGFDHSANEKNIMYPVSDCDQTMGDDMIDLIDKLYSVPSEPDLAIENASAAMHGNYLNLDIGIRNAGFRKAPSSKILVYADGNLIKTIDLDAIEVGKGRGIMLTNIWLKTRNINQLMFSIEANFEELDETNNFATLVLKK